MSRINPRILVATALLGAVVALAVFASPHPASAKPEFMSGFAEAYPEAAASQLNGCVLCHTSASPTDENHRRNQYGDDWEEEGDKRFGAIEGLDSDGDGYSNIAEIQALSFPGDPASTPLTVTTTTTLPGTAPDGAALYASACAACHGSGGGNLRGTSLGLGEFTTVVSDGRAPSMPAFAGSLSDAQIAAIYAYLTDTTATTTTTTPPATTTTVPGSTPDAAALFAASCAGCHGSDGGNLVPTGLSAAQLVGVIRDGRAPAMPSFGSSLTTGEIQALADYLIARSTSPPATTTTTNAPGTTSPPRSGATVYAASCAACHGAAGGNLVGTPLTHSQLVSTITTGFGSMPGFSGRLPSSEIDAVARYIRSLAPAATTSTTLAGTVPDARALFAQHCAGCHGASGEGGPGGSLAGTGLARSEIRSIVSAGTAAMPAFGSRLGAAELDVLVDHVAALGSTEPAPGQEPTPGTESDPPESSPVDGSPTPAGSGATVAGGVDSSDAEAGPGSPTPTVTSGSVDADAGERFEAAGPIDSGDPGPPGSPLIPVLIVLLVVLWLGTDAVRSGQLNLPWPNRR